MLDPPLALPAGICAAAAAGCWLVSMVTRTYSQVDRLWSVLPPVYPACADYQRTTSRLGPYLGLLFVLIAGPAQAREVAVRGAAELGAAIAAAAAGDTIVLEDGDYPAAGYTCAAEGTAERPITIRARNLLQARVRFDAVEGFKVSGAHWRFEGLDVRGTCADDSRCEHAFHVTGGAVGFVLRASRVVDFNAQLKVNAAPGVQGRWLTPDRGLVEGCEISDTRPRRTANPVTKLNIDTGDDWIVRANVLRDFQKGGGDGISYGAFLKGGGRRGLFERNLVLCARDFAGGVRIGLSLGGGGTAPQFCAPAFDPGVPCSVEHEEGILRNNIIAGCSDVGIYVNRGKGAHVLYNTLIATSGIDLRFAATSGEARGNVLAGRVRLRDGAQATIADNLEDVPSGDFLAWYQGPLQGDLRRKGDLSRLLGKGPVLAAVPDDYCARRRGAPFDLGALQHSLGDCATTRPPAPAEMGADGGTAGEDAGPPPGLPPGPGEGCACRAAPSAGGSAAPLLLCGLCFIVLRRRSRRARGPGHA